MKTGYHAHPQPPHGTRSQAGSLTVEMALVLPILISLVLGIIEIANIMRIQLTMDSAVTAIAHDAAMHETTQGSAAQYMAAKGLLTGVQQPGNPQPPAPVLTLTPPTTTTCKATPCTPYEVKLTYNYQAMTALMQPFFDNIKLTASARKISEPW